MRFTQAGHGSQKPLTAHLFGSAGESETDTVTAIAKDEEGRHGYAQGSATVYLTAALFRVYLALVARYAPLQ